MAEEKKKAKKPTPVKRQQQDEKKSLRNQVLKSKIHTARKAHAKAEGEEKSATYKKLSSIVDKAVKTNVYTPNKAARIKSRAAKA